MQPRLPIPSAILTGIVTTFVLFTLSLTFGAADATEGDEVNWLDRTENPAATHGAISFEGSRVATQLLLVDVSETREPATVINLQLDQFQSLRIEVVDLEGRLVKTLADGLWARGRHQMAWHHENERDEVLESGKYFVRLSPRPMSDGEMVLAR